MQFSRRCFIKWLSVCGALVSLQINSASAEDADPAVARMRVFYDALLSTMKVAQKLPIRARYEKLEPAVRAAFDLPAMTRIAIGPQWTALAPADQQALVEQFSRLTIATYANRFDGYSGEHFEVDTAPQARGANKIVHSSLVRPKADPITLDYLMRSTPDGWKAIDVYLQGTISELATRRSEFSAILRSGGASLLLADLKQRVDKLLQPA